MNYLITGPTGNIGSLVVNRLLDRSDRPRVLVRDAQKLKNGCRFGLQDGFYDQLAGRIHDWKTGLTLCQCTG
jgi:nucleoside-diphosphate-sugar epimerase